MNRLSMLMLRRKKEDPDTFMEKGAAFEGNLKFSGTLRIDGDFTGDILQGSTIIVGEKANINGNIKASNVIFSGEIHGDIVADEKVEVCPSGRVFGSIRAPKVLIDERAVFVGTCDSQLVEEIPKRSLPEKEEIPPQPEIPDVEIDNPLDKSALETPAVTTPPPETPPHKDPTEIFLEDCCESSPDNRIQAKPFYEAYRAWCETNNHPPLSMVRFGQTMTKKYSKITVSGRRFYQGIGLAEIN